MSSKCALQDSPQKGQASSRPPPAELVDVEAKRFFDHRILLCSHAWIILVFKGNADCSTVSTVQLKPVKAFNAAADTASRRNRGQKQAGKQIKQCLNAVQQAKAQCKPFAKCCSGAKT